MTWAYSEVNCIGEGKLYVRRASVVEAEPIFRLLDWFAWFGDLSCWLIRAGVVRLSAGQSSGLVRKVET